LPPRPSRKLRGPGAFSATSPAALLPASHRRARPFSRIRTTSFDLRDEAGWCWRASPCPFWPTRLTRLSPCKTPLVPPDVRPSHLSGRASFRTRTTVPWPAFGPGWLPPEGTPHLHASRGPADGPAGLYRCVASPTGDAAQRGRGSLFEVPPALLPTSPFVSGLSYLVSGLWYLKSGIWYLVSGVERLKFGLSGQDRAFASCLWYLKSQSGVSP